jgi:hypothetical protein
MLRQVDYRNLLGALFTVQCRQRTSLPCSGLRKVVRRKPARRTLRRSVPAAHFTAPLPLEQKQQSLPH